MTENKQKPVLKSIPFFLIVVLTTLIFVLETLTHFFLTDIFSTTGIWSMIFDPIMLSAMIFPLLYILVYKPFKIKIIQHERTAEALRKSLKETSDYKYALDESSFVVITNQKGVITYANDNFCNITKYAREELIGQDHRLLSSVYHSKDFFRILWETIESGKVWRGEVKNKTKDGTFLWLDTAIIPFLDEQAKPFQYLAIRTNITKRKEAEQELVNLNAELENKVEGRTKELTHITSRLNKAQEIAHLGSWELDFATGIVKWSDEACKIYGLSPAENIQTYNSWLSFIHPEDLDLVLKVTKQSEESLNGTSLFYRIVHKDGFIKHIYSESMFEFNSEGKPTGLYGIAHDVTELKKSEQKLEQQNKELQKTNSELDRFVYSTSHDLRAPLKSMLGLADIINKDIEPDNEVQLERMQMMKQSVIKLDDFIEEILHYSRNTRMEVAKEEINFEEMIQEIRRSHKFMEGTKGINLQVEIHQREKFFSDKRRVNVILNNLISNAIKYRDVSKKNSFLNTFVQCNNENAIITIEDNGIGIDGKDKEKIFEMFYRATKLSTGSGLGMYIVKETLEKLGGTIDLVSELNKGAKFTITLPNQLATLN